MQRPSNQDADGTVWATGALRLGEAGMDLRRPSEPPALADLLNARFLDERTLQRRNGYAGGALTDRSAWPAGGNLTPGAWTYGHGTRVTGSVALAPNTHYPEHTAARQVFQLGDQTAVWTGDRLLLRRPDGLFDGSSSFWVRASDVAGGSTASTLLPRGIPAHLPLVTDVQVPASLGGAEFPEVLATADVLHVLTIGNLLVTAARISRSTGDLLDTADLTGTSTSPVEPSLVSSAGVVTAVFRDTSDGGLRIRFYTGNGWTAQDFVTLDNVSAYDVRATATGFVVVWLTGTTLKCAVYAGTSCVAAPVALSPSHTPAAPISICVSPVDASLGVAYRSTNLYLETFSTSTGASTGFAPQIRAAWTPGTVSVSARLLSDTTSSTTEWVVHSDSSGVVKVNSVSTAHAGTVTTTTRANSDLLTRSWTVGDEVFAWCRSRNSGGNYLLCGAVAPYVAGFSERETGVAPYTGSFNTWPTRVQADPADPDGVTFAWIRFFVTGTSAQVGNLLIGLVDHLPALSVAQHGRSAYLSGSCVKNWDGRTLADAGFHDYPTITPGSQSTGGFLTVGGTYNWLARAVWYNDQGERFESSTVISAQTVMTASNTRVSLAVSCVPATSMSGVTIEVYRTTSLGTAYYLEGTVTNDPTTASVTFLSSTSDATLITQAGDPHETGFDVAGNKNPEILERFAPLGCAILATVGDRLWGAGGQVPAGRAQFSLLRSGTFGAGFDDLGGYVQVDNEGGGVTSVAASNNAVVVLEADRVYVMADTGPDNYGNGTYAAPELRLAAGASTHAGTCVTQLGVLYWGTEGPLLLDYAFRVQNLSSPVRPLTSTLTPTAVQVDVHRMEVVWFCGTQAVLLNYMGGAPRWARWSTPNVVGASPDYLVTTAGRLLAESATASGDDGVPFQFLWRTGNVRPEALLQGATLVQRVGVLGKFEGSHQLRARTYFDGSPLWSEEAVWSPTDGTWLGTVDSVASLVPAQVDAQVGDADHSGAYASHKRLRRQNCHYFAVEVSDISSGTPTCTPFEMSFVVGARPGLGRTPVTTYTGQGR